MCDHIVYTVGFERRHLPLLPNSLENDAPRYSAPAYSGSVLRSLILTRGARPAGWSASPSPPALPPLRRWVADHQPDSYDPPRRFVDTIGTHGLASLPAKLAVRWRHTHDVGHRQPAYHCRARTGQDRSAHRCRGRQFQRRTRFEEVAGVRTRLTDRVATPVPASPCGRCSVTGTASWPTTHSPYTGMSRRTQRPGCATPTAHRGFR